MLEEGSGRFFVEKCRGGVNGMKNDIVFLRSQDTLEDLVKRCFDSLGVANNSVLQHGNA